MSARVILKQKGFTLVELIVILSLVSVVFFLVASFFGYGLLSFRALGSEAQVKMQIEDLMNSVVEDIRSVNDVDVVKDDSGFIQLRAGNSEYTYDKSTLKVYKNGRIVARNIASFYVGIGADARTVNIVITGKGTHRYYTLTTSVVLRR
ncbi:pilus assembly FimT family protein [Caldanaerobius polysaccharolyticus]|uniref:pilus assembly FimT family protein n=1 Tax=Caldanaerobius polysaccharolyticus TaxID=44256 RepID=UPI00047B031B|nr:type II secretion system protein [Caldanaerobius polysaccharolyticus]